MMAKRPKKSFNDRGMTLIELIVVAAIVPMIVGVIVLSVAMASSLQTHVSNSVGGSGDIQAITSVFYKDTQSAAFITTSSTASQCGTGTQILGLEWGSASAPFPDVVTYALTTTDQVNYTLVRNYCNAGFSSPAMVSTVSNNVSQNLSTVSILPAYFSTPVGNGWVSDNGITSIGISVTETTGGTNFKLNSAPSASGSSIAASIPGAPAVLAVAPLSTSADISLTPSQTTGGATVTTYTVTAVDTTNSANGGQTCSSSSPGCTVTGLTTGDTYTFTATASNEAGNSSPSSPSPSVIASPPATFTCTHGDQTWTVPSGVHIITATVYGAQGGDGAIPGGLGGETSSEVNVTPGQVLTLKVGCRGDNGIGNNGIPANGGWNGGAQGGANGGGGGGGSTEIDNGSTPVVVAGGGGGGGGQYSGDNSGDGGSGGGYSGYNGGNEGSGYQHGGDGASQRHGGYGGSSNNGGGDGQNGGYQNGGSGASDGGGGGGGYYGGGGGAGDYSGGYAGAGGGGGSSISTAIGASSGGANSGDGSCSINY